MNSMEYFILTVIKREKAGRSISV